MRTRIDFFRAAIRRRRSPNAAPQISWSCVQSSSRPPQTLDSHAGAGSSGMAAGLSEVRSLFHSIWKATRVGMRSSTSVSDAISTASVPLPSSYHRRRRPGADASAQSMSWKALRAKTSMAWPMTTRSARITEAGSRRTA